MIQSISRLTLLLAGGAWLLASVGTAAETAQQVMDRAHHGRATWQKFPGFTANIAAASANEAASGTLHVSADGKLEIKLQEGAKLAWVDRSLQSLIGHRLADDQGATNVAFADEDTKHPMGRLLKSNDASDK